MIYSFTTAGGGVPGRDGGTAPITTTEAGPIINTNRISTDIFLRAGEMTTEIIIGKDTGGITDAFPIRKFNATGTDGKETDIGNNKDGV